MILFDFLQSIVVIFFRVLPVFLFVPVFSSSTISNGYIRAAFILVFCLPLTQVLSIDDEIKRNIMEVFFYEFLIGLFLAIPAALPFWIANVIGEIIDNQRGATISNTIDPSVGVEASPLSSFFLFITNVLFLISPGILLLIKSLNDSYILFPYASVYDLHSFNFDVIYSLLDTSLFAGIVFVLPVLASMFITEVFLGILSRFSPQMNTFSLSLTVKSFIGIGTLFLYFSKTFPNFIMEYFNYAF